MCMDLDYASLKNNTINITAIRIPPMTYKKSESSFFFSSLSSLTSSLTFFSRNVGTLILLGLLSGIFYSFICLNRACGLQSAILHILDFWILLILDFAKFCLLIWLFCDLAVLSLFVVLSVGLKHL